MIEEKRIGSYTLHRVLGEGGMGIVYLAELEGAPGRQVALKLVREDDPRSTLRSRFEFEKEALLRLEHPNVARILDASVSNEDGPWFTMEYVDGLPIMDHCRRYALTTSDRLTLFEQVCRGVQHAHQKGVLHRDLKPSNVLVATIDGQHVPKIIDFGIARLLDEGSSRDLTRLHGLILGTPEYMSPEQLDPLGFDVDTRADVYGLGALLYELVAGVPPFDRTEFEGRGLSEVRRIVREVDPRPPLARRKTASPTSKSSSLGRALRGSRSDFETTTRWTSERTRRSTQSKNDLDCIALKALSKERDRRYPSVDALLGDLDRYRRHLPVEAVPPRRRDHLRKFLRRRRVELSGLLLALIGLVTAFALTWNGWVTVREAQRVEESARAQELVAGDALRVPFLIERARAPWPAETTLQGNLDWITAWVRDVDEVLSREPFHRAGQARVSTRHERAQLEAILAAVPTLRELRAEVLSRPTILRSAWPLWERCARSIEAVAGFESTTLAPLPHLLPLGIELDRDREHGRVFDPLWIFAIGGTGELPVRVDLDGNPVGWGEPGFTQFADETALLLLLLPGGTFRMGSQGTDPAGPNYDARLRTYHDPAFERPVLEVHVAPFFLSRYELTQAQFTRYLRATGRTREELFVLEGPERHPVIGADWRDAMGFCRWADLTLPSESQWEYACRAGTSGITWRGDAVGELDRIAWTRSNAHDEVQPVDSWPAEHSPANPWGLYHMLGNVMEWPLDSFFHSLEGLPLDGTARVFGGNHNRARRGGDVTSDPMHARPSVRGISHGHMHEITGFRPALTLR
ncbi:MAG: SUMF1/EgtB/PvdO family nonheme iron enzyme [Planctomycetes bacterium]|nr:SUMF1/EgtB/PvdO family nonheme iron enzyme [Planctomycetota bacterium]